MVVGAVSVMGPASVFVAAARRTARRSHAAAVAATRPCAQPPSSGYRARVVPAPSCGTGSAHVSGVGGVSGVTPIRSGHASASRHAGRRSSFRGYVAAHAEAPPSASSQVSDIDVGDDDDVQPNDPPSVVRTEGNLAILHGLGGDVKPGTLLKLGDEGDVTAILLSHREPKSFALLYTNGAGPGGAPAVGSSGAETLAPGGAVEVIRSTHDKSKKGDDKEEPNNTFRMPGDDDVEGRWLGALGQPLDGGDAPGGGNRNVRVGGGSELLREPPSVEDRKPITTPLITGVKALDVLTPVGRGQCMLLTGETGTQLSRLGLAAIAAQMGSGVRRGLGASMRTRQMTHDTHDTHDSRLDLFMKRKKEMHARNVRREYGESCGAMLSRRMP